jgi:hypothetical protein
VGILEFLKGFHVVLKFCPSHMGYTRYQIA